MHSTVLPFQQWEKNQMYKHTWASGASMNWKAPKENWTTLSALENLNLEAPGFIRLSRKHLNVCETVFVWEMFHKVSVLLHSPIIVYDTVFGCLTQSVDCSCITAVDKKLDPLVMMSCGDLHIHLLTQKVHSRPDWRGPGTYSIDT